MASMKYLTTGSILAFSIAQLNSVLTTIILIVTLSYWIIKTINEYRGKNKH
jgi:hypothetical protein